jgi:hypothetical protein
MSLAGSERIACAVRSWMPGNENALTMSMQDRNAALGHITHCRLHARLDSIQSLIGSVLGSILRAL